MWKKCLFMGYQCIDLTEISVHDSLLNICVYISLKYLCMIPTEISMYRSH